MSITTTTTITTMVGATAIEYSPEMSDGPWVFETSDSARRIVLGTQGTSYTKWPEAKDLRPLMEVWILVPT